MKPLYFVIFFSPQFFIGQQSALLGIDFGMTKTQVKKEINTNKKTYKKIRLGGYFWRLYHQNNRYNVNGELTTIKLTPTDGGLYGLELNEAKLVFDAAIRRFKEEGYEVAGNTSRTDDYFEYHTNETYFLAHTEKKKAVYIETLSAGANVYLNLEISKVKEKIPFIGNQQFFLAIPLWL